MSSWFGGGSQQAPPPPPPPQGGFGGGVSQMQMAQVEVESIQDMFNRMTRLCWTKCIPHSKDAELNVGELSCTDRCVGKYLETHYRVGEKLRQFQMQQQQMQQQ